MRSIAFVATAFAIMITLALHIIWVLSYLTGLCFKHKIPYAPCGYSCLTLIALMVLILLYGFYIGRWQFRTTRLNYSNADIPAAFDGYRIVHISDLHLTTFDDNPAKLESVVDMINALEPDLICFTGDLVSISSEELERYIPTLKRMHAADGIASVLGNHDFSIYALKDEELRADAAAKLASIQRDSLGWNVLRNENIRIRRGEDSICIIGVDNTHGKDQGFSTLEAGDLPKAMAGADGFRILLTHDPSHWTSEVIPDTDIPLTLCGHTHAAQIRIFGWTPARWLFKQSDGRYDIGSQTLYINIGIGGTVPFRIGANPEITLISLFDYEL